MIQRIQSVFLLLTIVALALMFSFPIYEGKAYPEGQETPQKEVMVSIDNAYQVVPEESATVIMSGYTTAGLILVALAMLLSAVSIFLFRNRARQLKIVRLTIVLDLVLIVLVALMLFQGMDAFDTGMKVNASYGYGAIMPVIALILLLMAARGIRKDEELVRSADRLR